MKQVVVILACAAGFVAIQGHAAPASDTPAEIAACVVDNDATDVRALLKTVPGSPTEAAAAKPVMQYYGSCDDNKAVEGVMAWRERAEIANAALLKRIGGKVPNLAGVTQPGWAFEIGSGQTPGTDYDPVAVGTRMFGDCIVRAAPQAASDLARSTPGSVAEGAAIDQLAPVLAPCIPAGQNMRVKRADLRLIVAEPLYHMISK